MFSNLIKNWKTTVCGIATIAAYGLEIFNIVPPSTIHTVVSIFVSLGLLSAADAANIK